MATNEDESNNEIGVCKCFRIYSIVFTSESHSCCSIVVAVQDGLIVAGYVPPSPSLYGEGLDATYSLGRFSVPLYFRQRDYDEMSLRKENDLMDDPNGICAFYVRRHLLRQFKDHTLPQLKSLCNVLDIKVGKNRKDIVSSLQSHYNDKIRRGVQDAEVTVTQETVQDHELSDLIRTEEAAIGEESGSDDEFIPSEDELSEDGLDFSEFTDDPNGYDPVIARDVGNRNFVFCGIYLEEMMLQVNFEEHDDVVEVESEEDDEEQQDIEKKVSIIFDRSE
jgi:hypothetical protein